MKERKLLIKGINYASNEAPPDLKCDNCGAHNVKIWREYQTLTSITQLLCTGCAIAEQKPTSTYYPECDSIGWMVPAIPVEGENTFWGYTSIPEDGVNWWRRLPEIV